MIQNLTALNTAAGNVSLELSRLPNIPAVNIAVQVNTILRNQQRMNNTLRTVRRTLRTVQQTQQADHRRLRRLKRIQRSIQALYVFLNYMIFTN